MTGVEIHPSAVADAREAALRNGLSGKVEFLCQDAARFARENRRRFDAVVVDPPRRGLDGEFTRALLSMAPPQIVYVSCNPATPRARCRRALAPLCPRLRHAGGYVPLDGECGDGSAFVQIQCQAAIELELNLDERDLNAAERKVTYDEIQAYVQEKHGLKVSSPYTS